MKILIATLSLVALVACKKNYTCTCTYKETTESYDLGKLSKGDAKAECEQRDLFWQSNDGTCELAK